MEQTKENNKKMEDFEKDLIVAKKIQVETSKKVMNQSDSLDRTSKKLDLLNEKMKKLKKMNFDE